MYRRSQEIGLRGLFAAACVCLGIPSALGNSICVTCEGPAAVYSCSYAPNENGSRPQKTNRALQFICIQDVARQYKHASCSVRRHELDVCNGQVHMMSPLAPQASPSQPNAPVDANTSQIPGVAKKKPREPKTVVEMAKQTARKTQKQIDKSAKTVSKAARSTWRCISSLFSKC